MIVPHHPQRFDPTVVNIFNGVKTDIPIVPVTIWADYKFNEDLRRLDKYILADYCEYGWDFSFSRGQHFFGQNTADFKDKFPGEEWDKFEEWVTANPPLIYFKRELFELAEKKDNVFPADYPAYFEPQPIHTLEQFQTRPISVFNYFGRSHEARLELHADIWLGAVKYGYNVCDNIYQFNKFLAYEQGEKWVSLHIPHYDRVDLSNILAISSHSKLSLALWGAGRKTFRHAEISANSILTTIHDSLLWAFPWEGGKNCIKIYAQNPFNELRTALQLPVEKQYELYLNCAENWRNYYFPNYTKYLQSIIDKF